MYKLNEKQQRPPFGGHQYNEYGVTFRGESFPEVVKKLSDFRLNNNIKVGDPEQDVLNHYATHWPWTVSRVLNPPEQKAEPNNYSDWRKWVVETWARPPAKMITAKEATDRWSACLTCPYNVRKDWEPTKESEELDKRVFVLRRGIDVPSILGYCTFHKCDIGVIAYIDKVENYAKNSGNSPSNCWVDSTKEDKK